MAIIELDQNHHTPPTEYNRGNFRVKYAYSPKRASLTRGKRGEDYLVVKTEGDKTAFALCDGVGESFYGGLGSQIIGESLVDWLWFVDLNKRLNDGQLLADEMREVLEARKPVSNRIIQNKSLEINEKIMDMGIRNLLEESGTQTNFVCGVFVSPSHRYKRGIVFLFWLGDAQLKIYREGRNISEELNANWSSSEGWSSRDGVIGQIHYHVAEFSDSDCVIAFSDGFKPVQHLISCNSPLEELQALIGEAQKNKDDDVSIIQIQLSEKRYDLDDDLTTNLRYYLDRLKYPSKYIQKQPETKHPETNQLGSRVKTSSLPKHYFILLLVILFLAIITSTSIGYFIGSRITRQDNQIMEIQRCTPVMTDPMNVYQEQDKISTDSPIPSFTLETDTQHDDTPDTTITPAPELQATQNGTPVSTENSP